MESAIALIERLMADNQASASINMVGHERQAITEIFRTLDMCAFAFRMAPNRLELVKHDRARHLMLIGAASALKPLLAKVETCHGPMPWHPSNPRLTEYIDDYLWRCGALHSLHRLASLEQYGLSRTRFDGQSRLKIEVDADEGEAADRQAETWLIAHRLEAAGALTTLSDSQLKRIRRRLDQRSEIDLGWFIRYSFDEELMARSLRRVKELEILWPEAEALPDNSMIGGRSFRTWKDACCLAAAQALSHLEFCSRLVARHRELDLRNLLTLFRTRNDIANDWRTTGYEPVWADMTMRSLLLDCVSIKDSLSHYDTPFPFYVDLGPDYVLTPSMAALMNPFVGMVRHLSSQYGKDWDKAVNSREDSLRNELAALLPAPRFEVSNSGFELKRPDGSVLTDIDAVVADNHHGTLALFQIKWHDVFSRSLRERASRRSNMLSATKWIDRVSGWIEGRTSREVASALGMKFSSAVTSGPPVLIVMTRHAARFSGEMNADQRSAWISWPEFARCMHENLSNGDILRSICFRHTHGSLPVDQNAQKKPTKTIRYNFSNVEIEVTVPGD